MKNSISPFYKTGLELYLKKGKIGEAIVMGIMTNLCVRSTVSDAYGRGIGVTIIKDACVSDSEVTDRFTLQDIKKTRLEVNITYSKAFIKSLG